MLIGGTRMSRLSGGKFYHACCPGFGRFGPEPLSSRLREAEVSSGHAPGPGDLRSQSSICNKAAIFAMISASVASGTLETYAAFLTDQSKLET